MKVYYIKKIDKNKNKKLRLVSFLLNSSSFILWQSRYFSQAFIDRPHNFSSSCFKFCQFDVDFRKLILIVEKLEVFLHFVTFWYFCRIIVIVPVKVWQNIVVLFKCRFRNFHVVVWFLSQNFGKSTSVEERIAGQVADEEIVNASDNYGNRDPGLPRIFIS